MTYAEELSHTLKCAEERFGARVWNGALPQVTFHDGGSQVYFPTIARVAIRLSRRYEYDYLGGCYSLAHETVHLLAPVVGDQVTTLEEGIAVLFARDYVRHNFDYEFPVPGDQRYAGALALAERFLAPRPDALLRLRVQEPVISRITAELIQQTYPEVPTRLCYPLTTPFHVLSTA